MKQRNLVLVRDYQRFFGISAVTRTVHVSLSTLEQNPHFYLRCPTDATTYTPMFRRHPLQDTIGALEHNDTVYVLFDGPGRVFLHAGHTSNLSRIFGNVWLLNGFLIFRGLCRHRVSYLNALSLTCSQIVLEYLRENNSSEIRVPDMIYDAVNGQWGLIALSAVPK